MNKKADYISLVDSLQPLNFVTKNRRRFIPKFIKRALKCWTSKKFRIANPDKSYNSGDVHVFLDNSPSRKINYVGLNNEYLILSYEHGGKGHHSHILIFKYFKKNIAKVYSIMQSAKSKEEAVSYLQLIKKLDNIEIGHAEF